MTLASELRNPIINDVHEVGCNPELCPDVDEMVGTCPSGSGYRYNVGEAAAAGNEELMNLWKREYFRHITEGMKV